MEIPNRYPGPPTQPAFANEDGTAVRLYDVDRVIAFRPELARLIGSIEGALIYQQLCHWSKYSKKPDGSFYKTAKELEEETTVSENKQRKIRQTLIDMGWIEAEKKMANGSSTWHYRVNVSPFITLTSSTVKSTVPTSQNHGSITIEDTKKHILSDSEKVEVEKLYRGWLIEFVITYAVWVSAPASEQAALLDAAKKKVRLTDKKKHLMVLRLRELGFATCVKAIKNAAANPWNHGENPGRWKASIAWLFKSDEKIEEWSNR